MMREVLVELPSGTPWLGLGRWCHAQWDEDDVMLFLWGNSKASKDHYRKQKEESTQRTELWRQGTSQVPV